MKRTFLILPAAALLFGVAASSCSGNGSKGSDSDTAQAAAEPEEELEEFSSPDLGLWHLTGPVSGAVFLSYVIESENGEPAPGAEAMLDSLTFSRAGMVTSMVNGRRTAGKTEIERDITLRYADDGVFTSGSVAGPGLKGLKVKLSRSSGGYLQVLQVLGADGELSAPGTFHRLIEWTRGLIYSIDTEDGEGTTRDRYHYGDTQLPERIVTTIADMGFDMKVEDRCTYTAFDKYGNWTERRVATETTITEGEADGTNMKTEKKHEYRIDRRVIYYYPPGG